MTTTSRSKLGYAIGGTLLVLLLAVAFASTRIGGLQGTVATDTGPRGEAPELEGIDGWLNGEARTLASLRGSVVLIDFWTYSCINCIRTIPVLRGLYEHYGPFGLEVIGVHAPEFEFEKDEANVRAALDRYGVTYPVAIDNEMDTWRAYGNRFWPHVYLIDAEGQIRFDHIGEGGEAEIESQIRALLAEAGRRVPSMLAIDAEGPSAHITPEVYAGRQRGLAGGHLGNPEGYPLDEVRTYAPVDEATVERAGTRGVFFLEGPWRADEEFIEAAGPGARVVLPFFARDVFMVAAGTGGVRVLIDDAPPGRAAGADLMDGGVRIDRSDLYRLVRFAEPMRAVLTVEVDRGFRLFTFTFG